MTKTRFLLTKTLADRFQFSIIDEGDQVIAESRPHETKDQCLESIDKVRELVIEAEVDDQA